MDPRTIADARALWSTIRRDLFGAVRYWNRWKFASEPVLPVAKFDFEMAGDKDASTAVFDPGQMREIMAEYGFPLRLVMCGKVVNGRFYLTHRTK
jgi:hypothetical protein